MYADKTDEFLYIQKRAGQICQKHVKYHGAPLQKADDVGHWLEIHWYPDEDAHQRSTDLINAEPKIRQLWQEFQAVLDPEDNKITEECCSQVRSEDNLPRQ